MTNLVRAGLARITNAEYEPLPTMYDSLFPNGTLLTAARRAVPPDDAAPVSPANEEPSGK